MSNYKFYMRRLVDGEWESDVSLEDYFSGMKVVSCTGLSAKGKIKNIYTEKYAETSELRVFIPNTITRENTEIEFVFGFEGDNRRDVFDNFVTWVSGHKIRYWDTCRNRDVDMVLIDEIDLDEDFLIGSSPYILVPFKFKNLNGDTKKHVTL